MAFNIEAAKAVCELAIKCTNCGRAATCFGAYEHIPAYGCDTCCGHGNEDGWCKKLDELLPAAIAEIERANHEKAKRELLLASLTESLYEIAHDCFTKSAVAAMGKARSIARSALKRSDLLPITARDRKIETLELDGP